MHIHTYMKLQNTPPPLSLCRLLSPSLSIFRCLPVSVSFFQGQYPQMQPQNIIPQQQNMFPQQQNMFPQQPMAMPGMVCVWVGGCVGASICGWVCV